MPFVAAQHTLLHMLPLVSLTLLAPSTNAQPLQQGQGVQQGSDRRHATVDELLSQADALSSNGKFLDAIPLLTRVIHLLENASPRDASAIADAINLLGVTYFQASEYGLARTAFERSLAMREGIFGHDSVEVAQSVNNLANAVRAEGDLVHAEALLLDVVKLQQKLTGADSDELAEAENNLASLYDDRGDWSRAEPLYKSAIAILRRRNREPTISLGRALNNLGLLYQNRGDLDRAALLLQEALQVRERLLPPQHPDIARALANLGTNQQERGQLDAAETLYQRAIAIYIASSGADSDEVATTAVNRAMIHLLKGDYQGAEPLYKQSLEIRERVLGPMHPDTGATLERLSVLYQVTHREKEALQAIRRATAIAEHNLLSIIGSGSEQQKTAYMGTLRESTDIVLSMRHDVGANDPEFTRLAATVVVQRKGRVLDTLIDTGARLRDGLSGRDRALFEALATARAELAQTTLAASVNSPSRTGRLADLEREIDRLERELASHSLEARVEFTSTDINDIRAALPNGAVLVEFVKYHVFDPVAVGRFNRFKQARYAAFVLHHDAEPAWKELGTADDVERAISEWRQCLVSPVVANEREKGRALHDLVVAPVASALAGATHVFIVPDDALNLVPFAAMTAPNGRYLVEDMSLSYLSSSRDVLRLHNGASAQGAPVIVAAPAYENTVGEVPSAMTLPPLPGAAREGAAIRTLLPGARVATGPDATETFVKSVHGPSLLHLATHAFFLGTARTGTAGSRGLKLAPPAEGRADDPTPLLRAAIMLSRGNMKRDSDDQDGILTALEAASLDLRGTALVVLSACETGIGETRAGDGVYGFRRALAIAGAETQVLTLWRVDDDRTADLVIDFYKMLTEGKNRQDALRRAQLKLVQTRHLPPFFWASFVLAGNVSAMDFGEIKR